MEYKKITLCCLLMIGIFTSTSCKDEGTGWTPDMIPDDEVEVPGLTFQYVIGKVRDHQLGGNQRLR